MVATFSLYDFKNNKKRNDTVCRFFLVGAGGFEPPKH
jgi:hypothetical protein